MLRGGGGGRSDYAYRTLCHARKERLIRSPLRTSAHKTRRFSDTQPRDKNRLYDVT
jgi:hypothetical protein